MGDRISEIKSLLDRVSFQLVAELEAQKEEIQRLKEKVAELEKFVSAEPKVVVVQQDQIVQQGQIVVPEPVAQPEPAVEPEPLPIPEPVEEPEPIEQPAPFELEESYFTVTDLNEVRSAPKTTLSDMFAERNTIADMAQSKTRPWMVDIPGPKVEMIQSALTFNDRLTFIRDLFEGDSEQFNITLDRINETSTFDEVVSDMRDAYPEWDENSQLVYRFYMEVRRKFRD